MTSLVALAAGLASRFGGPKQIAEVGPSGETLLDYSVFDARRAGFGSVVLVVRPGSRAAFEPMRARWATHLPVTLAAQDVRDVPGGFAIGGRTKPWGTAQAVLAARRRVGGPLAVVNADDFYGPEAFALAAEGCRRAGATGTATLVAMRLEQTLSIHGPVTRALCDVDRSGWLKRIEEVSGLERRGERVVSGAARDRTVDAAHLVSMNLWSFPGSIFESLEGSFRRFLDRRPDARTEFRLPDAVGDLISRDELAVTVVEAPGPWFGLTHAADRDQVVQGLRAMVEEGQYPAALC